MNMREVTTDDVNAAVRGLKMWGMTREELRALAEEQNREMFAGRVIADAAAQVIHAKATMGAE